jgi:hypothetical protein
LIYAFEQAGVGVFVSVHEGVLVLEGWRSDLVWSGLAGIVRGMERMGVWNLALERRSREGFRLA